MMSKWYIDGWSYVRTEGRKEGRMDGRMAGQMDGRTDGRMDGWTLVFRCDEKLFGYE